MCIVDYSVRISSIRYRRRSEVIESAVSSALPEPSNRRLV